MAEHSPEYWNAKNRWMRSNQRWVSAEERAAAKGEWLRQQRLELMDQLRALDEKAQVSG